jgi:hypothetical protein
MKRIVIRITTEVIGSPKEHVEATLQKVLDKLPEEEDIKFLSCKKYDCKQMESNKKLWSSFAEIEFETHDFQRVLNICYDYTPSTIEILEPAGMDIDMNNITEFLNDFLSKIHKYAMVLKKLQAENIFMMKELDKLKGKTN